MRVRIAALGLLIAAGCGKSGTETAPPTPAVRGAEGGSMAGPPAEPAARAEPTPPGLVARQGAIEVRITRVRIGKVALRDELHKRADESTDASTVVEFEVTNTTEGKKLNYVPWSQGSPGSGRNPPTLHDDAGNRYRKVGFERGIRVDGAVQRGESVYPGKSVKDVLVFEAAVDKATYLDLVLPGDNIEAAESLHFRLPASFFRPPTPSGPSAKP